MKTFTATAIALALVAISGCAQAESKGRDMKRADVENIIKEYLMENPEILREALIELCLLYTSPSPRDATLSRMPSSA